MVTVSRAQIGRYRGPDALDVTVKNAKGWARALAPTWDMVMGLKRDQISDKDYTSLYLAKLEHEFTRVALDGLIRIGAGGRIVLMCYCRDGQFCHTVLLARWLAEHYPKLFSTNL